jgi:hypothetical protein
MSGMSLVDKENAAVQSQVEAERAKVKAHQARVKESLENGPKMKIQFHNNEDPPSAGHPSPIVEFIYEGVKYELRHGEIYNLPEEVVSHLNSLSTPVYGDQHDPISGLLRSVKVSDVLRFMCLPVSGNTRVKKEK